MTHIAFSQITIVLLLILVCVKPLGWYMAQVYIGRMTTKVKVLSACERAIIRWSGINDKEEMNWQQYLSAMLVLNLFGLLFVYLLQRLQFYLPLNPQAMVAVSPDLSFNTAASFASNTDWQSYTGEGSLSYLTQALALTVQNFLSAATGIAILVAFIRGIIRHETRALGNYWLDMIRGTVYILLPLSLLLALALSSQGVIQNFKAYETVTLLNHFSYKQDDGKMAMLTTQSIPMGPVASQIAIKQLGSNGGGYFGVNSAHPFENPTAFSNVLELLAIILIPAALCYSFGVLINDRRQGWMVLLAMVLMFIPCTWVAINAELQENPSFATLNIEHGGNMEGKETRFGVVGSTLWACATTAVANGSVNSMHDSFTPLGGLIPLFFMHLGEVVFGGVGCGLYGMLMLIVITVFVSGLMVGRTPEYLGKKIEPFEMKMAVVGVLVMPLIVLLCTGVAVLTKSGVSVIGNPSVHGFSEILYAFSSFGANNGSAFAGLNTNNIFYNTIGGLVMLFSRYWTAIATIAIAGSLASKRLIPVSAGTLPTHTPLFMIMLISVTIIVGALSFLPSLALGPIAEHLMLWGQYAK